MRSLSCHPIRCGSLEFMLKLVCIISSSYPSLHARNFIVGSVFMDISVSVFLLSEQQKVWDTWWKGVLLHEMGWKRQLPILNVHNKVLQYTPHQISQVAWDVVEKTGTHTIWILTNCFNTLHKISHVAWMQPENAWYMCMWNLTTTCFVNWPFITWNILHTQDNTTEKVSGISFLFYCSHHFKWSIRLSSQHLHRNSFRNRSFYEVIILLMLLSGEQQ